MPKPGRVRQMAARAAFSVWPFSFGHVRIMKLFDPDSGAGIVTRQLRGFPLTLEFDSTSYLGRYLYFRGMYEEQLVRRMVSLLRPGMTFVDVGANIGLYSVIGAYMVGPNGTVVAIEPQSQLAERLADNIARNHLNNVRIEQCALGRVPAEATLYQINRRNDGQATLQLDAGEHAFASEKVQVRPLDAVLSDLGLHGADAIKLDVEGAEFEVLAGAEETFRRRPPRCVLVECIDDHLRRFGSSSRTLLQWLVDHGYALNTCDRGHWLPLNPADGIRADVLAIQPQG